MRSETSSVTEQISKMSSTNRPLAGLSNESLFNYPEADPSPEAASKFRHEILHRRGVTAEKIADRLKQSKANLSQAQKALETARDAPRRDECQRIVAKRTESLNAAQQAFRDVEGKKTWLTTEDINSHFRSKALPSFEALVERWKAGTLFNSQPWGFASFLLATTKQMNWDHLQFDEFRGLAHSCCEEGGKLYEEVNTFWQTRIMPAMHRRERFTEGTGESKTLCAVMGLSDGLRREYWSWFRAYNAMTIRFQWKDDGGVAYSRQAELGQSEQEPFREQF